jgi:hypothetical protein
MGQPEGAPEGGVESNVTELFPNGGQRKRRVDRGTDAELEEYRAMKPRLLRMLAEWEVAKNPQGGCPVLSMILAE